MGVDKEINNVNTQCKVKTDSGTKSAVNDLLLIDATANQQQHKNSEAKLVNANLVTVDSPSPNSRKASPKDERQHLSDQNIAIQSSKIAKQSVADKSLNIEGQPLKDYSQV